MTIRLDQTTIGYFKRLAAATGVACQTLIDMYLRECAVSKRKLKMEWTSAA